MRKTHTVIFTKDISRFLSIALIQAKAGPRISGTPFLVSYILFTLRSHQITDNAN